MDMSQLAWQAVGAKREDIRGFVGDVAEMGKLHLQLLAHEAALEKARLKRQVIVGAAVGIAAALTVLFALTAVILLCWDTAWRVHAIVGVPLVLGVFTVAAGLWLKGFSANHMPFARIQEELRKDGAWLMSFL